MADRQEIEVALKAFNQVRADVGGIKTEEQQRLAMGKSLDAVEEYRRTIK